MSLCLFVCAIAKPQFVGDLETSCQRTKGDFIAPVLIQGDLKEVNIVILLWRIEKCLNGTHNFFIQEFILGGLIIYHSFTLSQNIWPKIFSLNILEINVKWLFVPGVKKEFIVQYPVNFLMFQQKNWWHIFKSVSKVGYIMPNHNYIFFFQNKCYSRVKKKLVFFF